MTTVWHYNLWAINYNIKVIYLIYYLSIILTELESLLMFDTDKIYNKSRKHLANACTVCPRSLDLIYIVSYSIKWTKTSWTCSSDECSFKRVYTISSKHQLTEFGCMCTKSTKDTKCTQNVWTKEINVPGGAKLVAYSHNCINHVNMQWILTHPVLVLVLAGRWSPAV